MYKKSIKGLMPYNSSLQHTKTLQIFKMYILILLHSTSTCFSLFSHIFFPLILLLQSLILPSIFTTLFFTTKYYQRFSYRCWYSNNRFYYCASTTKKSSEDQIREYAALHTLLHFFSSKAVSKHYIPTLKNLHLPFSKYTYLIFSVYSILLKNKYL